MSEYGYGYDPEEVIRFCIWDPDYYGVYEDENGNLMFDRRLNSEGMERQGRTTRDAESDLIGPIVIPIPDFLVEELQIRQFFPKKQK